MIAENLQDLSNTIAKLKRKDIGSNARGRFLTQYARIAEVYTALPSIEIGKPTVANFNIACDGIMKLVPPTGEIKNGSSNKNQIPSVEEDDTQLGAGEDQLDPPPAAPELTILDDEIGDF